MAERRRFVPWAASNVRGTSRRVAPVKRSRQEVLDLHSTRVERDIEMLQAEVLKPHSIDTIAGLERETARQQKRSAWFAQYSTASTAQLEAREAALAGSLTPDALVMMEAQTSLALEGVTLSAEDYDALLELAIVRYALRNN